MIKTPRIMRKIPLSESPTSRLRKTHARLNRHLSFPSFKPNPENVKASSLVQIAQLLSRLPDNRLVDA
ncbi:hypothetical protein BYT27DRAFT_7196520 [Phlegmacium glaucopus]|nr:hypothetical protein BYT27DRAFT_7196520 [Phlegmacium glaucopus]